MIFRIILFFIFSICLFTTTSSQNDCGESNSEHLNNTIFGEENLIKFGTDTIVLSTEEKIIYSCSQCSILLIDKNGLKKWTINLSNYNCKLITFKQFHSKLNKPPRGCDIIIQFKNKELYGITSKNGKIKKIKISKI